MRFLRKSLTGLFLLSLTVAFLGWAAFIVVQAILAAMGDEPRGGNGRERVFAVNVVNFEPGEIAPVLNVFGEVQSRRSLEIRPSTGGAVVELHPNFVDGGRVTQGDVLLRIDPSNAQTRLDLALADVGDTQAELREANRALTLARDEVTAAQDQSTLRDRALQRQIDLVERGVGTPAQLETAELAASSAKQAVLARRQALQSAEARLDQATARLARLQISVDDAQRQLDDTTLIAGFDGVLSNISIVLGGTVAPNERVGQLVDPDQLEIAFRLSTGQHQRLLNDAGQLINADLTATLDILGAKVTTTGKISREAPVVGDGLTGRLLFADLDTPKGLRPGDFIEVQISEPPLQWVARLPAAAVSASNQVLVVGDGDRLREAAVNLIRRQGPDVLVRARDLRGAVIVAERSPVLGAGVKVRAVSSDTTENTPTGPEMVTLDDARRAKLIEFVQSNTRIPKDVRENMLNRLQQPQVPKQMVDRLESRMGG